MFRIAENVQDGERRVVDYYLAAEFRRAILWGIGGAFLIPAVALGLAWWQQKPFQLVPLVVAVLIPALTVTWGLQYLGPRIRVDQRGISQRCLWWWDLWPWEVFSGGRIRLGKSSKGLDYEFPEKPHFLRSLSLELLEPADAETLNRCIRQVWVSPTPQPLPESIHAELSWPWRFRIQMDADRLTIHQRQVNTHYRWDQIAKVEIWRNEHARADFSELFFELPGETIHVRSQLLMKPTKEEFVGFLCRYVDSDRIDDFSLNGAATSAEEIAARLSRLDSRSKELQKLQRMLLIGIVVITAASLVVGGLKAFVLTLLYLPQAYAIYWMCQNQKTELQRTYADLENQKRAFNES